MADDHAHFHVPTDFNRAFAIGTTLNLFFVAIEAGYGTISHSLALIADAGHNLSDVMALLLAWGAITLANRPATAKHTFGFKKGTILASLSSSVFLCMAVGIIIWEAVGRLNSPVPVHGMTITVIAAIGVVINTATALLFMTDRKNDLNIKGAFLHMAADAGVSAGVVVSGLLISFTGWNIIDPIISIAIAVIILIAGWGLLKDSLHLSMAGVPDQIDAAAVLDYLTGLPGVECVHDLHIWAASTTENILTAHVLMASGGSDDFLHETAAYLHLHFHIHHTTIQIERSDIHGVCHTTNTNGQGQCWPGRPAAVIQEGSAKSEHNQSKWN